MVCSTATSPAATARGRYGACVWNGSLEHRSNRKHMTGSQPLLTSLVSALSVLLSLAAEIGLLVVALTIVRSKRPDAALPLAAGAVLHGLITLLWPILTTFVAPALATSATNMGTFFAVIGLFTAVVRALGWAAILFGIVKLASPPSSQLRDPTRYG